MKIDLSPIPEIAKNIYALAKKIESDYGLNDISLKGIGIDGYFVGLGLAHVFREKYGVSLVVDAVEISSHGSVSFDKERMDSFRNEDKRVFLVDKRSKTGSLGAWIEKEYPEFTYAVLIDMSGKARISTTNEDFKWLRWGDGEKELYENAFDTIGLKIENHGKEKYEYLIEGPRKEYLLDALYKELDDLVDADVWP